MSQFAGGSPWTMARDIGEGYVLVTDRTLARMTPAQVGQLSFEIERCLRDIRGGSSSGLETVELQRRNRRIIKLTSALRVLRAHLARRRGR